MRRAELLAIYAVILGPAFFGVSIVIAMGSVLSMPRAAFWAAVILLTVGFASFAKAKASVISQGRRFTCGSAHMSSANRLAYFLGYFGMALGMLLLLGFTVAIKCCSSGYVPSPPL